MEVCEPDFATAASEGGTAAATHKWRTQHVNRSSQGHACETNRSPTRVYAIPDSKRETLRCVACAAFKPGIKDDAKACRAVTFGMVVRGCVVRRTGPNPRIGRPHGMALALECFEPSEFATGCRVRRNEHIVEHDRCK